jgi:hypothetical protein
MNKDSKQLIKTLFTVLLLSFLSFSFKGENQSDCKIIHKGTFKYEGINSDVKVIINDKSHTEYHENGKYIIQSQLDWVNNCEYNATIKKITIPNFPYKVGNVMNVTINNIEGNKIYCTSTVQGKSSQGVLIKMKN